MLSPRQTRGIAGAKRKYKKQRVLLLVKLGLCYSRMTSSSPLQDLMFRASSLRLQLVPLRPWLWDLSASLAKLWCLSLSQLRLKYVDCRHVYASLCRAKIWPEFSPASH